MYVPSFWFVQLCGFSLNFATLLAIGLSVGMLVTDTIVVLESITKHFASAQSTWEAARIGSSEVAVRGIASTMTHIVVLLPIGLMASRAGMFFRPFAVTTLIVNVVSFFISFTLTPVLCALLPKRAKTAGGTPETRSLAEKWEGMIARFAHKYAQVLQWLAGHRRLSVAFLMAVIAMLVHSAFLAPSIGLDFIPNCDKGEIIIKLEYPTCYDLSNTESRARQVEAALRDMPFLQHILTTIGKVEGGIGLSSEGVQLAQLFLKFGPKTGRARTVEQMLPDIRKRLAGNTDCIVTASIPFILGGQQLPIDLEIAGEDLDVLKNLAVRVQGLAGALPGIIDPDTTVRDNKPEILIRPRRTLLADANVPVRALAASLRANLEGIKAETFKQGARTYDIRVKFEEKQGVPQVEQFQLPAGRGAPVVLAAIADIQRSSVPVMITRVDKRRVVKVYANTSPGYPLGTAVEALSKAIDGKGHFPPGYAYRFGGNYELMSESNAGFLEAGIMAIGLTYLVLSSILGSFSRPLLILVTIPLGFIGVVWALYPTHVSMSIFVLLGMVLLIGIVVTTAVLVLDRVRVHERAGRSREQALLQAVEDEFRPVALVTLAAVLGMLPLAIGGGLGSELRVGIGIASMGGIVISAWLTLSVLPLAFLLVGHRSAAPAPPPKSSV